MVSCLRRVKETKTQLIRIGNQDTYALISSRGGTVTSFVCNDIDVIYPQKVIGTKLRGEIPICAPQFSRPSKRFAEEIPQHGLLRNKELEVVAESDCSVTLTGITKEGKSYPWHLKYQVSVSIKSDYVLELKLQVTRLKDGISGDAPVNPAFHPYFNNLGRRAVTIGNEEITDFSNEAKRVNLKGQKYLLIDLGKKKVQMMLGGDFAEDSCVALWSDNEAYFCVEPILQHPDNFDTPTGKYLKQGESLTLICSLKVLN